MKSNRTEYQHKDLASGRWQALSFAEQMGNIGSEVSRMVRWRSKDKEIFEHARMRALELTDLTIADARWNGRHKELERVREALSGMTTEKTETIPLESIDEYFLAFARLARKNV